MVMKIKKLLSVILILATLATVVYTCPVGLTASANVTGGCSSEYKASSYYKNLVKYYNLYKNKSKVAKVIKIAMSQEGYSNYWGWDHDWTGNSFSWTDDCNTEYTRWMASNILCDKSNNINKYSDVSWCAIFASWCLYRADVYPKNTKGKTDYAYGYAITADPRIVVGAKTNDQKIENFNINQRKVIYTPIMRNKLKCENSIYQYKYKNSAGKWVYNCKEADKIKYNVGGLIFFTWDNGKHFSHVGIVLSWNPASGVLSYIAGNENGKVAINLKNMNNVEDRRKIAAYAEY